MKIKHRYVSIIMSVALIISSFSYGQITQNDIVLGKRLSIESKILNETRDIYVYLPEGYEDQMTVTQQCTYWTVKVNSQFQQQ